MSAKRKRFTAVGIDAVSVIQRLAQVMTVKSDEEMARELGTSRTTISSWRGRGVVPYAVCADVAQKWGVSLDWLVLGKSESAQVNPSQACDVLLLARALAAIRPKAPASIPTLGCEQEAELLMAVYDLLLHDADDTMVRKLVQTALQ